MKKQIFNIGDKLIFLKDYGIDEDIEYVTITGINEKNKVYHWKAELNTSLGNCTILSGYFFNDAKLFNKKTNKL